MSEGHKKADILRKIIEILLHQGSQMIPTYLDNILSFANDKSSEVKKQVIGFIEELSKNHPQYLPQVVAQLRALLMDSVIAVQKRVIQASSIIYRNALTWICKGKGTIAEMQIVWQQLTELKLHVLNMIDSENEGIRTHSIKFLEEMVLLQTYDKSGDESGFSLDDIPDSLHFIDRNTLEQESESKYMPRVVQALGDLHTTLPPTLSQSQVNSVRKHLKMLLLNLIKHPSSNEMYPQLTQLLLDIGMTTQEIVKAVPKEKRNKRLGEIKNDDGAIKRSRLDSPQSNSQGSDNSNSRTDFSSHDDFNDAPKFIMNEEIVFDSLNNIKNVVSLVVATLEHNLPNEMPSDFIEAYRPIPNPGSVSQKRNLSKMLISLIKGEPIIPSLPLSEATTKIPLLRDDDEKMTLKNAVAKLQATSKVEKQIESAVSRLMEETRQEQLKEMKEQAKEKEKPIPPQTPSIPRLKQKVRLLKLQELTRPIPKEIKEKLMIQAVARILNAERDAAIGGASQIRAKLITTFASSYTPELREIVLNYIIEDPLNRIDLALNWLYEEYAYMQSFNRHPVTLQPKFNEKHDQNYNNLFCSLVTQICERAEPTIENAKDVLLRKLYSEAPLITDEGVDYLKHLVTEEKLTIVALEILEEICFMRPPRAHKYVTGLLSYAISDNEEIRDTVLKALVSLYKRTTDATKKVIEKYAKVYLGFIALNTPPRDLFSSETAAAALKQMWTDDLYKVCLNLIMMLFTENEELLVEVARVYGQCGAEAKRCVLRSMEAPARELASRKSDAFMRLLDECPRGAETLLTRLVHILTDKG
ncbi:Symplekin [Eumeta japonica]|uniref:Symplekin n=1 Tax=Eumeta variegata TaxID=151549 RepID=A0A4C1V103_EUMVA|nr:Symplekin [Eumeta japonica]